MDSNTQDADRAGNTPPDAPQRADGNDTQTRTDSRSDAGGGNYPGDKGKSQLDRATNDGSEADTSKTDGGKSANAKKANSKAADAKAAETKLIASKSDDASAANDTSATVNAAQIVATVDPAAVVVSSDVSAKTGDAKPSSDKKTDNADAVTPAIQAIVTDAAAVVAVAIPVVTTTDNRPAAPAAKNGTEIASIESAAKAAISANTSSVPSATSASNATATPAVSPTDATDAVPAVPGTTASNSADDTTEAAAAKAAGEQTASQTISFSDDLAATEITTPQAASSVPASGKPKSNTASTAAKVVTADADTTDKAATPQLSGQVADAVPRGAETDGKSEKTATPGDKTDASDSNAKQANAPAAHTAVEHRAPAVASHSATLDTALPNAQNQPSQPFQAQAPNLTATPVAQLNTTLANTPVPVSGLAVDIALHAASGASRFEIRLDPAELGRIDVRLDVDKHGQVTSHLTVERPATLDMLRRDAPQLQQALEDAGLKTGDGGLQFSLRDQSFSGRNDDNGSGRNSQRLIISEDDTVPAQVAGRTYGRTLGSSSGVDIRV